MITSQKHQQNYDYKQVKLLDDYLFHVRLNAQVLCDINKNLVFFPTLFVDFYAQMISSLSRYCLLNRFVFMQFLTRCEKYWSFWHTHKLTMLKIMWGFFTICSCRFCLLQKLESISILTPRCRGTCGCSGRNVTSTSPGSHSFYLW